MGKMNSVTFQVLLFLACTTTAIGGQDWRLDTIEAEIQFLRDEIKSLKEANAELGRKMDNKMAIPVWDCYKTQDMAEADIIKFDSCDVDTMSGDPSLGLLGRDSTENELD